MNLSCTDPEVQVWLRKQYDPRYAEGLKLFAEGEFYPCHDVFEDIWVECSGQEKLFYHALIQTAVSILHFSNGNWRGTLKVGQQADQKWQQLPSEFMNFQVLPFRDQFRDLLSPLAHLPEDKRDLLRPEASDLPVVRLSTADFNSSS